MNLVTPKAEAELEAKVREVGAMLLSLWPGTTGDTKSLEITEKPDGSYVTKADLAASAMIVSTLKRLFPGDGILSEELPVGPELQRSERVWIIDPLDGTHSFINGQDDFSILVGLCVGDQAAFGMMFFPCSNVFAVGRTGGGATINGKALSVSKSGGSRPQSVYVRNNFDPKNPNFFPERIDSGLAFLRLAEGGFDGIILNNTRHGEWDIAAPAAILGEAGGMMTDQWGKPIRFSKTGRLQSNCLIASNSLVHNELIELLPAELTRR